LLIIFQVFRTFVNFKIPKSNNIQTLIKQWIALYNKTDHTIFTTDGSVVFCQLCENKIVCTKKFQIQQHVDTILHNSALKHRANDNKKTIICIEHKTQIWQHLK